MDSKSFVERVTRAARNLGYKIEVNREGLDRIDFGNKKLHEAHLRKLYPEILEPNADIPALIEKVAPGRPCTHRPMKEIISAIQSE